MRFRILSGFVAVTCLGCAHSLLEKPTRGPLSELLQPVGMSSHSPAGSSDQRVAAHVDDRNAGSLAPRSTSAAPPLAASKSIDSDKPAPIGRTDFLLADLDRELNTSDSSLHPRDREFLRDQMKAIVTRSVPASLSLEPSSSIDAGPGVAESSPARSSASTHASSTRPVSSSTTDRPVGPIDPVSDTEVHGAGSAAASPVAKATETVSSDREVTPASAADVGISPPDPASKDAGLKEEIVSGAWRDHLMQALDSLERELAKTKPTDREGEQLAASLRILHLLANHREQAVASIESLSEDEREFWKHQLHALAFALDADNKHAGSRRAALALREIRDAADHLANLSTLDVRHLAFCESVQSYGVYSPIKTTALKPGQSVLLYVEIDNFASQTVDDRYETKLHAEYHIVDANGARLSRQLPPVEDKGRNRRRDYFISYQMEIPKELRPGEYALQLVIEDVIGGKSSQATLDFRIR